MVNRGKPPPPGHAGVLQTCSRAAILNWRGAPEVASTAHFGPISDCARLSTFEKPIKEFSVNVYEGKNIRNVAVAGHGGSGKTSLISAALFDSGATTRLGR